MLEAISEPIPIRGHTLLCLQGFRGRGYSPAFVDQLNTLCHRLSKNPDQAVQIIRAPDPSCACCPHLKAEGCHLHGAGTEIEIRQQDERVMTLLGVSEGRHYSWREILERIALKISGDDLVEICGDCQWLPLGFCREGLDGLRQTPFFFSKE